MTAPHFLIGARIALRPLEPGDAPHVARWMNDPEVRKHLHTVRPQSVAESSARLSQNPRPGDDLVLGVVIRESERLIGYVALRELDGPSRHGKLSLRLGEPDEWGKGYATEAVRLLVEHAFKALNLHRVWLHVSADNARAQRVYEKLGFVREGVLRQHRFTDGRWRDTIVMGLLESELSSA